jgi:anti-sigma B factor antagonist
MTKQTKGKKKIARIKILQEEGKTIVKPTFDIVATSLPELRDVLKLAIDEGVENICVDLSQVAMIDSMGLGLIIATHNSLNKHGGKLSVINVSKDVYDLFRNMRLDKHFPVISA